MMHLSTTVTPCLCLSFWGLFSSLNLDALILADLALGFWLHKGESGNRRNLSLPGSEASEAITASSAFPFRIEEVLCQAREARMAKHSKQDL